MNMEPPNHDIQDRFARGLTLYRAGRVSEARSLLDDIVATAPPHFDSLHLSGVIAAGSGDAERAVLLIGRAIALKPDAAAHRHLGNALLKLGRLPEAVSAYTNSTALRPDFKEAYVNRATAQAMLRRPAEALADFDRAIALGADDFFVHAGRGSALVDLKRPEEALLSCERALMRQPDFVNAHVNKAAALHLLGRYEDALAGYERALALQPRQFEAYFGQGASLHASGRLNDALAAVDLAIGMQPTSAAAHSLRATCLLDLRRLREALESCEQALQRSPTLADAHNTRGLVLTGLQRYGEAGASFDRAIELRPDAPEPHFNKGVRCLQVGDFAQGWELYESRPASARVFATLARPRWDGREDVVGKRLLIHSEQGLGDTLQFCRYAKLLAQRGARVMLAVQRNLCTLLGGLSPDIRVVSLDDALPDYDLHCPLLSLPRVFGTRLDSIPNETPYLHAEPARVARWRERLGTQGRLIGIRWQGSTGRADIGRSFPLAEFRTIADIPNVRLISLQKGQGSEQLLGLSQEWCVQDLGAEFEPGGLDGFLDVAAVMQCLDLIITSDTSIAHLAGALARPTWVALKQVPDWRWMLEREDCPWYPTMRLFRQQTDGDWSTVFARMRRALEQDASQGGALQMTSRLEPSNL